MITVECPRCGEINYIEQNGKKSCKFCGNTLDIPESKDIDMNDNSENTYYIQLKNQFSTESFLLPIIKQKVANALLYYNDLLGKSMVEEMIKSVEIMDINIQYLPYMRYRGSIDVDWSCIEVVSDRYDNDRYISRTGKAREDFDLLILCGNVSDKIKTDDHFRKVIEYTSIVDYSFIKCTSESKLNFADYISAVNLNDNSIKVTIDEALQDLARKCSYRNLNKVMSTQECIKSIIDKGPVEICYLPYVSVKYESNKKELQWYFILDPNKYAKPMNVYDFFDREYIEAKREAKRSIEIKKRAEEEKKRAREEWRNKFRLKLQEGYIESINNALKITEKINILKEQKGIFYASLILTVIFCLIELFLIYTDSQQNWDRLCCSRVATSFLIFVILVELLRKGWISLENLPYNLNLIDKVVSADESLKASVETAKNKLRKRKVLMWRIILISILMVFCIQLFFK